MTSSRRLDGSLNFVARPPSDGADGNVACGKFVFHPSKDRFLTAKGVDAALRWIVGEGPIDAATMRRVTPHGNEQMAEKDIALQRL